MFINNIIFGFISIPIISAYNILIISAVYLIPLLSVNILIPRITEGLKVNQVNQEMNSMKMKEEGFLAFLKLESYYQVDRTASQILFGNPESKMTITIITNPHCNPCAKMHKIIDKLLDKSKGEICIQYIFSSFNKDLDISGQFLISVFMNKDMKTMRSIYNEWFEKGQMDKESFFEKYKDCLITNDITDEYIRHRQWKTKTNISATPTILINGYKLPAVYKIEDMLYFKKIDIKT